MELLRKIIPKKTCSCIFNILIILKVSFIKFSFLNLKQKVLLTSKKALKCFFFGFTATLCFYYFIIYFWKLTHHLYTSHLKEKIRHKPK